MKRNSDTSRVTASQLATAQSRLNAFANSANCLRLRAVFSHNQSIAMKKTTSFAGPRLIAALLIWSVALLACANGPEQPKLFNYQIQWNVATDAPVYGKAEVKVLDYGYGVANKFDISPGRWLRDGFPIGGCCDVANEGIVAPRGDYLYFKWRVIATGEVFEDRVDLSKRLPQDMNDRGLYIAIFGPRLYVNLFPPQKVKQQTGPDVVISGSSPARVHGQSYEDTLRESAYAKRYQIYP